MSDTGGAVMVNLDTSPQDDVSIGIRHLPMMVPVATTAAWYLEQLVKFPPQFTIGFLSNTRPGYFVVPKYSGS